MSAGHDAAAGEPPGPSGTAAFFSNPLMSDVESDWSPIHDAAYNGRLLTLQRLLAQGTRVNLSTLDRVSPLHAACCQGHAACAKLLVERGANVSPMKASLSLKLCGYHKVKEIPNEEDLFCVFL
ncbi:Ankyrin repeat and SOCS box protein 9 [Liparis tanakae]|uniref:Ankyrin repeat and SOCS box protein 9 n=1 Tax=Liparis tanakae TaxID=230148 RepID=A0A4Z2E0V1_9TELE|nr:Ankyrin repeat and SOCS box protein 9 [Liparis tanakae]